MKKISLLILLNLCLFTNEKLFSQNEMRIGINAGGTYSQLRGNSFLTDMESDFGFVVGGSFEYFLNKKLSLKANLNFEKKNINFGDAQLFDSNGFPIDIIGYSETFNYLSLPVLVKFNIGHSNRFFINGGNYLGFLQKSVSKSDGYGDFNTTSTYKSIDFGLTFGFGTTFHLDNKNDLRIELRDNFGLINISALEVYEAGSIKTNAVNLIVTWDFTV